MTTESDSKLRKKNVERTDIGSDDEPKASPTREIQAATTKKPRCRLDANERVNLQDILHSFNEPISQEQAWALCYQTAKCLSSFPDDEFYEVTELSHIYLNKDGDVWLGNYGDRTRPRVSEKQAVFSLGMLVFKALDFSLDKEEERPLSPDLVALITFMTNTDEECELNTEERLQETDDEGIVRDSGDGDEIPIQTFNTYDDTSSMCSLKNVLQICTKHMQGNAEVAENHYRAAMRAYVAEALELSQFLETVATEKQASTSLQHLDTLDFNDWARFWVQVIGELRRGVKLKKVEANLSSQSTIRRGRGAEFELTPYEILMDDIRERRYRLRKTPSPTPHLRKDAHAVILEFIRSRPPLKKASERQLPPLQKQCTLRELLMESIKKPPKPLRSSRNRHNVTATNETSSNEQSQGMADIAKNESIGVPKPPRRDLDGTNPPPRRTRRVIPVDFDLKLDAEDEDDDDDDDYNDEFAVTRFEEDENESSNYWQLKDDYTFIDKDNTRAVHKCGDHGDDDDPDSANPWRKSGGLRLTKNEYHRFCDTRLESYDLATQCPTRRASARKHAARRAVPPTSLTGTTSLPHSRPQSRQHANVTGSTLSQGPSPNISLNPSPSVSPQPRTRHPRRAHTIAEGKDSGDQNVDWQEDGSQKHTLGEMLLDERLSLTLEEIVHIRSVLTKAELESLPVEGRVKEDVEKRRVCFLCLKTRFGLLGPWGQRCRLCERTVCVKCYSKMRIPTEHFSHIPVVLLSPGLLLSPSSSEPDTGGKNPWLRSSSAVGSAPASPASRRKDSALRGTPASTPTTTPISMPTPTSGASLTHGPDKRSCKITGSPAALATTKAFSTYSGPCTDQRLVAERLRGVAMVVCHDCRIMLDENPRLHLLVSHVLDALLRQRLQSEVVKEELRRLLARHLLHLFAAQVYTVPVHCLLWNLIVPLYCFL